MRRLMRDPMVWAATLLVAVAVAVVFVGSSDSQPELRDAETFSGGLDPTPLTGTVRDLTETVGDLTDFGESGQPLTETVGNLDDVVPGGLSGIPIFDGQARCAWLVGVPGTDSGIRHLVAWPTGTELAWEPFRIMLPAPSPHDVLVPGDRVAGVGEIFVDLAELADTDRQRLLGLDGCPHEAILVFDDRPDTIVVSPSGT